MKPIISNTLRHLAGAAAGAVALLALAGPASAQLTEIRFAKGFGIPYLPITVMQQQQLVEKQVAAAGLGPVKGVYMQLASGAAMTEALLSGNLDFATGGPGPLLTVWDRTKGNLNIKGIAAVSSIPVYLNTINPNVKTIADFTDKDRIAVPTVGVSTQAVTLQIAAEKLFGKGKHAQLDKFTVSVAPPDAHNAMMSGGTEITANFTSPPFMYLQVKDGKARRILTSYDVMGGATSFILMWTTEKFYKTYPKYFEAVLAALEEANAFIKANPRQAAEIFIAAEKSKLPLDFVEEMIKDPDVIFTSSPQNLMVYAEFMQRNGAIKNKAENWKTLFFPPVHTRSGS
ncbi:ABC transporter substrate-binding protein [Xanthobacter sp. KR7-225]|uniref:ABC transporter substrate-binding protein n=1 Tax=Xanthobacter sp. KR7-225 TaxID=3156613 RepID=UPI0032B522E6